MRYTFFILTVSAILAACNSSDRTNSASGTKAVEQHLDKSKASRQILIAELKKLQQIIASNNKEKIAEIFPFPLSDTAFSIYIEDSTYNEQFKRNGNSTTKAMFLQHYNKIAASIFVDQVNSLFRHLKLASLLYKDSLQHDAYIKTEPCFYSYKIEVVKDEVTLRMDMNSNQNYKSKKASEDEIDENASEICEHNFWWIFKFDGRKLHLTNISGAD